MDTVWTCGSLALSAADIDFLDPKLTGEPGDRERGVRLELRLVDTASVDNVYESPAVGLAPAVCRIDLLESGPGAADRMHWHPVMHDGDPGERVVDKAIGADPLDWLRARLEDIDGLLRQAGVPDPEAYAADAAVLTAGADEVVARVSTGLERARRPWPDVTHDERGLAPIR